jgi:hypothetical protein
MGGDIFRAPFLGVKNAKTRQLSSGEGNHEPDRDPEHFVRWRSW